jgi:hypothetical protein
MADRTVDPTTDATYDIEEDGTDALVADFIVSALDHVDGTQGYEEDGARLYQQQQQQHHQQQQHTVAHTSTGLMFRRLLCLMLCGVT